jgi:hypothetical protein
LIVVLYHGKELDLPTLDGVKNVERCYNPLCTKSVQTRPPDSTLAGRPKQFCGEKCRWKWKRKRSTERKHLALLRRMEELH